MPRKPSVPQYRLHKSSGRAVVTLSDGLGGRFDVQLGVYGSPESYQHYAQAIAEELNIGLDALDNNAYATFTLPFPDSHSRIVSSRSACRTGTSPQDPARCREARGSGRATASPDSASKKCTSSKDIPRVIVSPTAGWRRASSRATTIARSGGNDGIPAPVDPAATP